MEDERRLLDYAPPPVPRRGRIAAGILAYLFASYTVGVASLAVTDNGDSGWAGLLLVVLLFSALLPVAVLLAVSRGTPGLFDLIVVGALVGLFALAYRPLRRPT